MKGQDGSCLRCLSASYGQKLMNDKQSARAAIFFLLFDVKRYKQTPLYLLTSVTGHCKRPVCCISSGILPIASAKSSAGTMISHHDRYGQYCQTVSSTRIPAPREGAGVAIHTSKATHARGKVPNDRPGTTSWLQWHAAKHAFIFAGPLWQVPASVNLMG